MTNLQRKKSRARSDTAAMAINLLREELNALYERRNTGKPQPGDPERIGEIAQLIHDYQTGGRK